MGLLTVEQSTADYALLITHLRDKYEAWGAPVLTFGGSLAGTLAAFMRLKYPQIVDMAWARQTRRLTASASAGIAGTGTRRANFSVCTSSIKYEGCAILFVRRYEAAGSSLPQVQTRCPVILTRNLGYGGGFLGAAAWLRRAHGPTGVA